MEQGIYKKYLPDVICVKKNYQVKGVHRPDMILDQLFWHLSLFYCSQKENCWELRQFSFVLFFFGLLRVLRPRIGRSIKHMICVMRHPIVAVMLSAVLCMNHVNIYVLEIDWY